jgi:hypothetical protein
VLLTSRSGTGINVLDIVFDSMDTIFGLELIGSRMGGNFKHPGSEILKKITILVTIYFGSGPDPE